MTSHMPWRKRWKIPTLMIKLIPPGTLLILKENSVSISWHISHVFGQIFHGRFRI
uniref:Uncharacterized protein n=1 Tax=Lepeophtheirus salmonis TaxID=72036 RepID=A0A0K2UZ68_LEPSM